MKLTFKLMEQVSIIAHRLGSGWDGDDLNQECLIRLDELPDDTDLAYALKVCHNLCIDHLRAEELRAHGSTDNPAFFEPMIDGQIVDKEKYIRHIHDLRLRAIVDQYVDGERAISERDRKYLERHRTLLDRSFEKYLKQVSQFMLFYWKVAPFHVRLA